MNQYGGEGPFLDSFPQDCDSSSPISATLGAGFKLNKLFTIVYFLFGLLRLGGGFNQYGNEGPSCLLNLGATGIRIDSHTGVVTYPCTLV